MVTFRFVLAGFEFFLTSYIGRSRVIDSDGVMDN